MEDRRINKTKTILKEKLLELLKNKQINEITVSQVTNLANVGRSTFYLHYNDIFELYEDIEKEIINELIKIFNDSFPSINEDKTKELSKNLINYIYNNKNIFQILINQQNTNFVYKLKKLFYNEVFNEANKINPFNDKNNDKMESIFVVSGIVGIIEKWILDNFIPSKKEISGIINKIILKINKN